MVVSAPIIPAFPSISCIGRARDVVPCRSYTHLRAAKQGPISGYVNPKRLRARTSSRVCKVSGVCFSLETAPWHLMDTRSWMWRSPCCLWHSISLVHMSDMEDSDLQLPSGDMTDLYSRRPSARSTSGQSPGTRLAAFAPSLLPMSTRRCPSIF